MNNEHFSYILNKSIDLSLITKFDPDKFNDILVSLIEYYKINFPKDKNYEVIMFGYLLKQKFNIDDIVIEFLAIIKNKEFVEDCDHPYDGEYNDIVHFYTEQYKLNEFMIDGEQKNGLIYHSHQINHQNNYYPSLNFKYRNDEDKRSTLNDFINYIIGKIFYINKNNAYFEIFIRNNTFMDYDNVRYQHYFNRYDKEKDCWDPYFYVNTLRLNRIKLDFHNIKDKLCEKDNWYKKSIDNLVYTFKYIFDLNYKSKYKFDENI